MTCECASRVVEGVAPRPLPSPPRALVLLLGRSVSSTMGGVRRRSGSTFNALAAWASARAAGMRIDTLVPATSISETIPATQECSENSDGKITHQSTTINAWPSTMRQLNCRLQSVVGASMSSQMRAVCLISPCVQHSNSNCLSTPTQLSTQCTVLKRSFKFTHVSCPLLASRPCHS